MQSYTLERRKNKSKKKKKKEVTVVVRVMALHSSDLSLDVQGESELACSMNGPKQALIDQALLNIGPRSLIVDGQLLQQVQVWYTSKKARWDFSL